MISSSNFRKDFLGFNIVDCIVRRKDFLYLLAREDYTQNKAWREGMDAPSESTLKKRVIAFMRYKAGEEQWAQVELASFDLFHGGLAFEPVEHLVCIDTGGSVYASGKGVSGLEGNVAPEQGGPLRGAATKLVTVGEDLYLVGGGRSLAIRRGVKQWDWMSNRFPYSWSKDRETAGFRDMHGADNSNLYAVGRGGDVWNYRGVNWNKCAFPSNLSLSTVCCAPDGTVYVSGYEGETYRGAGDLWKQIAKPELSIPFKDMVWYGDRVWCTNDYGLWWIKGDKLEMADVPSNIKVCSGNLSARDGVLLLAGYSGAAVMEEGQWKVIFNYNEMAEKASS
jgi:hypothetical protein